VKTVKTIPYESTSVFEMLLEELQRARRSYRPGCTQFIYLGDHVVNLSSFPILSLV
jgi:hypothetical protein